MMKERFVIQWRSQANGRAGRGRKVFTRDEAEQLVGELNREYPDILHEVSLAPEAVYDQSQEPVGR